ncbi:MAG: Type 1 glutamine amidotransferase-like domain-containing protein [Actinomycetota bacterium]
MRDPRRHSHIALVGSGEFTPAMADIDREILESIGPAPNVVILPTAAGGEDPQDWALRGIEHFWRLGARSVGLMVIDRAHAEDPDNVRIVERADLLYISGGKTARLLTALEGSPLWEGFLVAREAGAWLVGSSAGAMALGDWALVHRPEDGHGTPTLWTPGLGILQGYAVVPHFDRWTEAEALADEISRSCSVIGIDEDTAVLLHGTHAIVAGAGRARVIGGEHAGPWRANGERFDLI